MVGRNILLAVGVVIGGLLLPSQAMAQYEAITDADLNLRVGPGTQYGVIDVIPYGDVVDVYGCLEDVEWCDVEWYGLRGWVSAHYLVQPGTSVYLPQVYARIGLPIIVFSFETYHERHYHDRPWFKKRHGHWRGRDWRRGDRPRRERAEERRERREAERPREKRREAERPREKRREAERPRRQRQEAEEPRRQRQKAERPRRQRQEAEEPRRQRQKAERPRQAREVERPQQRQRPAQKQGRSGSGGPPEELLKERGQ